MEPFMHIVGFLTENLSLTPHVGCRSRPDYFSNNRVPHWAVRLSIH